MKFKKAYYRVGKHDYKILSIYTILFDPFHDVYLILDDPQGAMHRCVYHGRQYYNIELGHSVKFDELPAPVKKKVAYIEARGFTEMQQSA